jgi:hypothetical protein
MKNYTVSLHHEAYEKALFYLGGLRAGRSPGKYLGDRLRAVDLHRITAVEFIEMLMRTKLPQIFAESDVYGDGTDWNREELSILGDINVATPVTVFDNGRHQNPDVHKAPFEATLIFTPGALLRNGKHVTPADWEVVTEAGEIDPEAYYRLYERRLLPGLIHANQTAESHGRSALVTLPGIGCGQFAGKFRGQLGLALQNALIRLLETHGKRLSNISCVYYDPYGECENQRLEIHGIRFLVRPLTKGNENKPQLCEPAAYEEEGDDFQHCELFSFVAWDPVSWPGNDFYLGSRVTDDGVKAAATNVMYRMTGIEGKYDARLNQYLPPAGTARWLEVVRKNNVQLEVKDNLFVYH